MKSRKMTIKYWNSLSRGSKQRALISVFPLNQPLASMLLDEKPDLKKPFWQYVFKKAKQTDSDHYRVAVNGVYMC